MIISAEGKAASSSKVVTCIIDTIVFSILFCLFNR
jgi:hypothetical protein